MMVAHSIGPEWQQFVDGWLIRRAADVGTAVWNGERGEGARRHVVSSGAISAEPFLRQWIRKQVSTSR